jgi:hypothetical protein
MLDLKKAHELCTAQELELVVNSRTSEIRTLTPDRLKTKVGRARNLRDKFRDLARQQVRESRGKVAPRGKRPARGNARTVEKAELFDDVLKRFEARAAELQQEERRKEEAARALEKKQAAKRASKPKRGPVRRARAPGGARKKGIERARAKQKQVKLQRSPVPRAKAHVKSRNRRNQARRDAR